MEDLKERIKTAVEFLTNGYTFKVKNLRFGMLDNKTLYVTGWSSFFTLSSLNKKMALHELDEIKEEFFLLRVFQVS